MTTVVLYMGGSWRPSRACNHERLIEHTERLAHHALAPVECRWRPRMRKFSFRASYSTWFQPMPTPSRKRPPVRTFTAAACFATSAVWHWGRITMLVTSSRRRVASAQVLEEDEHLVERALVGVGRSATALVEALQPGPEHVVEHQQWAWPAFSPAWA
jgi:hypothetical protein